MRYENAFNAVDTFDKNVVYMFTSLWCMAITASLLLDICLFQIFYFSIFYFITHEHFFIILKCLLIIICT
jgi:hypothetical protein